MATIAPHPSAPPPIPAVARILGRFEREQLASFIEVAIGILDVLDGDPDLDQDGDELDGSHNTEDEFVVYVSGYGAGCPVSDPGEDDDPGGGNVEDEGEHDDDERDIVPT